MAWPQGPWPATGHPPKLSSWSRAGDWKLVFLDWVPEAEHKREALCSLANGNIGLRGAAEESPADQALHTPGTYLAGGYERIEAQVGDQRFAHDAIVNWPNPLALSFRPRGGPWLALERMQVLVSLQTLDLHRGVLQRRLTVRDAQGRESLLVSERLVHMTQPQLACLWWTLIPGNWSGVLELRSGIDGEVRNTGVADYPHLRGLSVVVLGHDTVGAEGVLLSSQTRAGGLRVAQAVRTRLVDEDAGGEDAGEVPGLEALDAPEVRTLRADGRRVEQRIRLGCERGRPVRVEKVMAMVSSRDRAVRSPERTAAALVQDAAGQALRRSHERAWAHLWQRCDLRVRTRRGDARADAAIQVLLRMHVFHILQTVSRNSIDLDVGIPARGLGGEAYHGHVFWDDLFVFPFLNLHLPELSRALLLYRYRRLPQARRLAARAGYEGAMFPWRSGVEGTEETPALQRNPRTDAWLPDHTELQRHVNAAIAYDVWRYYQATGDSELLSLYGAELILEIARFWASSARLDPDRGRYEIRGVVGPDEFHAGYPDASEPGIANNAYTNVMAAWTLRCAGQVLDLLPGRRRRELCEALDIGDDELVRWRHVACRMRVPFLANGVIAQFDGYEDLRELDWAAYRQRYGDIQRIDRILQAEGDSPKRYKVSKQADVLMLFYLFSVAELRGLFAELGYPFEDDTMARNVGYYGARTSHGSTLSRVVFSWVLARLDRAHSWALFRAALRSDIDDIQGGTTGDGLHIGAMAGTVDLVQRCYTGIEVRDEVLHLDPRIPEVMEELCMPLCYRGAWIDLRITGAVLEVCMREGWCARVCIAFRGQPCVLERGQTRRFRLGEDERPNDEDDDEDDEDEEET